MGVDVLPEAVQRCAGVEPGRPPVEQIAFEVVLLRRLVFHGEQRPREPPEERDGVQPGPSAEVGHRLEYLAGMGQPVIRLAGHPADHHDRGCVRLPASGDDAVLPVDGWIVEREPGQAEPGEKVE